MPDKDSTHTYVSLVGISCKFIDVYRESNVQIAFQRSFDLVSYYNYRCVFTLESDLLVDARHAWLHGLNPSLPTDKASDRLTCLEKSECPWGANYRTWTK